MKKRFFYAFLFGIPGFFIAGMMSIFAFGSSLGFLWLFVFGDNSWLASTEKFLTIFLLLTFLIVWMGTILLGYQIGKRLESSAVFNRNHLLISTVLTILFFFVHRHPAVECGKYRTEIGQHTMQ